MCSRLNFSKVSFLAAILIIFIFSVDVSNAQKFQGGINFMLGFPQGEFRDNVDDVGFGLGGFFGVSPSGGPLMFGAEFGFLIYGMESRKEPFSTTIPDVTVDVETSNNIVLGHLFLRLQSPVGKFRPYVEGLVGFNYLFTRTTIKNESLTNDEVASSTNFDDATMSYGTGGGVLIRVYDGRYKKRTEGRKEIDGVFIDFRVRYFSGGEAEYLKEGSIRRPNSQVEYDVEKSRTDLLTFHLGVVLSF